MAVPTTEQQPPHIETDEVFQYWGYLFKKDNLGTKTLNRLLQGIARYIVCSRFLTPNGLR